MVQAYINRTGPMGRTWWEWCHVLVLKSHPNPQHRSWFIRLSPADMASLSQDLQGFLHPFGGFFSGFLPSTVFLFVNFYKIPILESNLESWFQKFSKNPRLMVHIHVGLAQVPYELGQERWRFPTSLPKNPHVRLVRDVQSYQLSARSRKVPGTKRTKPPCHATSGLKP